MKIKAFFYSLGQGIKNMFRNKGYTLASIATIASCLFLFGLFYAVITNFSNMLHSAEQNVQITVFFNVGTTEDQISQLQIDLKERPEVKDVTYISADQAWEDFVKENLTEEDAQTFTENPLKGSENLEVTLADVSQQDSLVSFIEDNYDYVRQVNRSDVTADALTGANRLIGYISAVIIAILFVVSIFLISNTVATGIINHKDEIEIMKYIGATDFFVRAPYVFEGMLIGLVGSLVPLVVLYVLYGRAITWILEKFTILSNILSFVSRGVIFSRLIPIILILGVGIGFIGSTMTIRKHLHV